MNQNFPFDHFLNISKNKTPIQNINPSNVNNFLDSKDTNSSKEITSFTSDEFEIINTEILSFIKECISLEKFNAYFDHNFKLVAIDASKIIFTVTTRFIKTIITNHYYGQINDAIVNVLGKEYEIDISLDETKQSLSSNSSNILNTLKTEQPSNAKNAKFTLTPSKSDREFQAKSKYINHMNPAQHTNIIDKNKTFESFVIGPSNNMAFATAQAVAKTPGKMGKYPSLYTYSDSGLGKTHLLHAIANEINKGFPELAIFLITARDFMKEMISFIQEKKLHEFQKKYTEKVDILMIDDIHELKGKEGTQDEFFHIFNELHTKGKQLIFTSDKSPKEIDGIAERIKTRLQWGLVIDIQKPDLETRIAILKKKAKDLDLFLHDDIITLIASSIKSNIRELEGSLIRLSAFSDVMKIEIDIEMVKDILLIQGSQDNSSITMSEIAKITSQYFKIPLADIKSKARNKDITLARHVAMYLSQKILKATLKEIGRFYGGRDHTSVIHGIEKIKNNLKTDLQLSKDIVNIETHL